MAVQRHHTCQYQPQKLTQSELCHDLHGPEVMVRRTLTLEQVVARLTSGVLFLHYLGGLAYFAPGEGYFRSDID